MKKVVPEFSKDIVKNIAASYDVEDGPNAVMEKCFTRPGKDYQINL